jgi:hypothetical protein
MSKKLAHQATGLRRRIRGRHSVPSIYLLAKTNRLVVISVFPARPSSLAVKKRFQLRGSSLPTSLFRRATAVMLYSCEALSLPSHSDRLVVPLLGKAKTWVGLTVKGFILLPDVLDSSCSSWGPCGANPHVCPPRGLTVLDHDTKSLRALCRREPCQALSLG